MLLRLNKKISIDIFFVIILVSQYFLPSTYIFLFGLFYLIFKYFIIKRYKNVYVDFPLKILFFIVIYTGFIGLINIANLYIGYKDYFRDLFYFISPIVFYLIGQMMFRDNDGHNEVVASIWISGLILSVICIVNSLINISTIFNGSVQTWRSTIGNGYYETTLSIIFTIYFLKNKTISNSIAFFSLLINGFIFLITFSRTNIIVLFVFAIVMLVLIKDSLKSIKWGLIIFGLLSVSYFILSMFDQNTVLGEFYYKISNSLDEMSTKSDWTEYSNIVRNWRGYESSCAMDQWNNYSGFNKIFGFGLGERIYVGEPGALVYKNAVGDEYKYLPVLHNGYSTMMIKGGIFGVFLYILVICSIFVTGCMLMKNKNYYYGKILISISILIFILSFFVCGIYKDNNMLQIVVLLGCCSECKRKNYKKTGSDENGIHKVFF